MATVNTASVREEIARVEHEIDRLSETGKVSDESPMLLHILDVVDHRFCFKVITRSGRR